jgi:hypothetical protein
MEHAIGLYKNLLGLEARLNGPELRSELKGLFLKLDFHLWTNLLCLQVLCSVKGKFSSVRDLLETSLEYLKGSDCRLLLWRQYLHFESYHGNHLDVSHDRSAEVMKLFGKAFIDINSLQLSDKSDACEIDFMKTVKHKV